MCLGSRGYIQIVETCSPAWSPDDRHPLGMTEGKSHHGGSLHPAAAHSDWRHFYCER